MDVKVTLSANAGVMLEYDGVKVLSDILHNEFAPGFSSVPGDVCTAVTGNGEFSGAELFLVSHDHPDHFSKSLAISYLKNNMMTAAAAPFKFYERQIVFSGIKGRFKTYGARVDYLRTPHENRKLFSSVKHYSYIVSIGDAKFAFLNDAEADASHIDELLGNRHVTAAFLNFPWLTLRHLRETLFEHLETKNIIIYHLPIPQEDSMGYNEAVKKALRSFDAGCEVFVLSTPLDSIQFDD